MFSSIIIFLLVLSVLVVVHELGHFLMARRAGVWVEEFGFGLPPRFLGKKIGETIYSLNLFPFGGFVRLHGENSEEEIKKSQRAFLKKSKKVRSSIVIAGVIMNFLLAIVAFAIGYSVSGIPRETKNVKALDIAASSPAQVGGVLVGDIIRTIDDRRVTTTKEFISLVEEKKGKEISLGIERNGERLKISVTPRVEPPQDEGPLGVTISSAEIYFPPVWQRPFVGIFYGFKEAVFWGKTVILGLLRIFQELFTGRLPQDVSGPVGIFAITSEVARFGILSLVNFIGILSMNLAILNIIPFPALDGGRLLFIFLEKLIGRRVIPKIEAAVHTAGMVFLLLLLLAITVADVRRLIAAGSLSRFLETMLK